MSDDRSEYTVTIGGLEHTLLLTSKDAERYGKDAVLSSTKAATKANKAAAPPANKAASTTPPAQ